MGMYETIQKLENMRKKQNMLRGVSFVVILFPFFSFMFMGDTFYQFSMLIPIFIFGGVIMLSVVTNRISQEYKNLYKGTFVVDTLKACFDNTEYWWERGFNSDQVANFGLTQMGNRFSSEDYLKGTYKGVDFEQADVTVKYKSSGKNSTTTIYFKGRMFAFDFPYKPVVSVQVFSSNFAYRGRTHTGFRTNKIEMESSHFNKKFDVKSVNELDAFYVLTPHVMERIENLRSQFGNVAMHFCGKKLYVGINMTGNAFDGDLGRKIDYLTEQQAVRADAKVIMDIIETLGMMKDEIPEEVQSDVKEEYSDTYNKEYEYDVDSDDYTDYGYNDSDLFDNQSTENSIFKLKRY